MEQANTFNIKNIRKDILERFLQPSYIPFDISEERSFCDWQILNIEGREFETVEYVYVSEDGTNFLRYRISEYPFNLSKLERKINIMGVKVNVKSYKNEYRFAWKKDGNSSYLMYASHQKIDKRKIENQMVKVFQSLHK